MTKTFVFLVWHDERIQSAFTTKESAEAFIETHFPGTKDVWINTVSVTDIAPTDITPPITAYVVHRPDQGGVELMRSLWGNSALQKLENYDPTNERAIKIQYSPHLPSVVNHGDIDLEEFQALEPHQAIVCESKSSTEFTVFAKSRETAETRYLEELQKREGVLTQGTDRDMDTPDLMQAVSAALNTPEGNKVRHTF